MVCAEDGGAQAASGLSKHQVAHTAEGTRQEEQGTQQELPIQHKLSQQTLCQWSFLNAVAALVNSAPRQMLTSGGHWGRQQ